MMTMADMGNLEKPADGSDLDGKMRDIQGCSEKHSSVRIAHFKRGDV